MAPVRHQVIQSCGGFPVILSKMAELEWDLRSRSKISPYSSSTSVCSEKLWSPCPAQAVATQA